MVGRFLEVILDQTSVLFLCANLLLRRLVYAWLYSQSLATARASFLWSVKKLETVMYSTVPSSGPADAHTGLELRPAVTELERSGHPRSHGRPGPGGPLVRQNVRWAARTTPREDEACG